MLLIEALRLGQAPYMALVGAGGKTTIMFQVAREYLSSPKYGFSRVMVCATTHLATHQHSFADHHFVVESPDQVHDISRELPEGVLLFTAGVAESDRSRGLSMASMARLRAVSSALHVPLIVEADGSRQRPLKTPAGHEPAIPEGIETVVVVAGLSALGKPLDGEWVHRPEIFARISGIDIGDEVTSAAVAQMLKSPAGGCKNIPRGARRIALLNQANNAERQASANRIAIELRNEYHAVIIASLDAQANEYEFGQDLGVIAVHEPVVGILLAAGQSTRLGAPKQLLTLHGETLVHRGARIALEAGLAPVVVVTGANALQVEHALSDLPIQLAYNQDWGQGQSTSVRTGLQALPGETGSVVFLLADQPYVSIGLLRGLVETHARTLAPIVAPQVNGQRANPVLFDRVTYPDLLRLEGDVGGRVLFSRYQVRWLPWHDANLLLDVDDQQDYQRLLEMES